LTCPAGILDSEFTFTSLAYFLPGCWSNANASVFLKYVFPDLFHLLGAEEGGGPTLVTDRESGFFASDYLPAQA